MKCTVYVIYLGGEKLPKDEVRLNPAEGWLYYGKDDSVFYPRTVARLLKHPGSTVDVITPLPYSSVLINRGGIMVSGMQEVGIQQHARQRWWCVPIGPDRTPLDPAAARTTADRPAQTPAQQPSSISAEGAPARPAVVRPDTAA